ncbi:kinase-regulated stress-responsive transcription factor skn7 [Geranomyces variabilis]|uniref:Kinase-regulated stress-responsive transcription factor skn7 n=1 Tax=Geranomyces variabilis TaxID=109894 RepID=A0AAD5TPM3_9FUNG|nr:kinase-regulated stress-responsive transcription factor skn7 [Geranomyces variabilis]
MSSAASDQEESASPVTQADLRKPDNEPQSANSHGGEEGSADDGGAAPDDANTLTSGSGTTSSSASVATSGGVPDFVKKLFRMLEDTSESDIVGWGVNGDTFVVREPNEFAKTVLPKHFKHNNPASFVRQLNKYGFHKIRAQHEDGKLYGDSAWEFQHPNFQLNKKEMLESIRRKTTSKGKSAAAAAPAAPPSVPTSDDKLTTILRKDTTDLQSQVDNLTRLQADIAGYLEGLSRNYRMVVEEVLNFRKNMAAQDQVIRSLVNYIAVKQTGDGFPEYKSISNSARQELPSLVADDTGQSSAFAFAKNINLPTSSAAVPLSQGGFPPGFNLEDLGRTAVELPKDESQRIYSNYENVARASVHQMNEISRHVRQAYSIIQSVPSGLASGSPSSGAEAAAASAGGPSTPLGNTNSFSQPGGMSASSSCSPPSCAPSQMGGFPLGASQQGGLTVFTVGGFTPRRDDVASEAGQGRSSPARPPNSMRVTRATCVPPWSVPPKVLLVEDDITCRKLSSKLLQVVGCAFDVAVDGLDAVERMGVGTKYDIVLMDIVMPNLDGVTATNRIRQFDQFTPIISMTSNTTENDCINYLANGMNDILAKPFNKHSMLNMIERYCNHLVGQRAAALGIPMAIASAGRRWEGLPSNPSGNSGRISEIDMDEGSPSARVGENTSQQMALSSSSSSRKGKEPAVSLPTSTMSTSDAVAATTALVGEMAREGGMSADCFSDVLNMSLNEMTGLGILPFGNIVPEGGYMSALGLDQYDARGAGSSSASSSQPLQPQHQQHQQQHSQQQQQQQQEQQQQQQQQAYPSYTSYTDATNQQQQQQHLYSHVPSSSGGGSGGGGSANGGGGGGGGSSLLSVPRLRKRSRDTEGTSSDAPSGLDASSSSSSRADSAESAAAHHLNQSHQQHQHQHNHHHAGNPADAANSSAMYISTTAAVGSKKPKTNHL